MMKMMKITKTIGALLARATHKECFKSMLCARCAWRYNGGCSEWNMM